MKDPGRAKQADLLDDQLVDIVQTIIDQQPPENRERTIRYFLTMVSADPQSFLDHIGQRDISPFQARGLLHLCEEYNIQGVEDIIQPLISFMKASVDREHVENTYCPALQKEDMQLRAAIDLTRQGSVVRPEGRVQDSATSENVTQSQPSVELLSMAKVCDSVETILGYSDTQRRHTSAALALGISFRTDEQRAMLQQILSRNYSDEKELKRACENLINMAPLRLLAERPAPAEEQKYYQDIGTDGLCLIRCMLRQRAQQQGRTVPANLHVTNPQQRRLLQQELEHIESTSSMKNRRVITPFLNKAKAMIRNPAHSRIPGEDYPPPEVFLHGMMEYYPDHCTQRQIRHGMY